MERQNRNGKYKYDNKFMVSYPTAMYLDARKWAVKKGLSIQDLQRKAMEFYLNHLNHDNMVFNNQENDTRKNHANDGKRKYLTK